MAAYTTMKSYQIPTTGTYTFFEAIEIEKKYNLQKNPFFDEPLKWRNSKTKKPVYIGFIDNNHWKNY